MKNNENKKNDNPFGKPIKKIRIEKPNYVLKVFGDKLKIFGGDDKGEFIIGINLEDIQEVSKSLDARNKIINEREKISESLRNTLVPDRIEREQEHLDTATGKWIVPECNICHHKIRSGQGCACEVEKYGRIWKIKWLLRNPHYPLSGIPARGNQAKRLFPFYGSMK